MSKIRNNGFLRTLLLVLVLSLLAAGCGNGDNKSQNGDNNAKNTPEKKFVMKFGSVEAASSVKTHACELFKEKVEKATNGNVTVEVYPASQLGNARAQVEATQMNTQQASLLPTANYVSFFPSAAITDIPYLFPNREITYKVLDGEVGDEYLKSYDSTGIHALTMWESGFKQLTGNFEITKPESFKGKKIRVMESPILMAQYKAMGATGVPVNFSETYNALQQNVVDGQENPMMSIYDMKFHEVQKCIAISDHGFVPLVFGVNKGWWDSLPQEYQTIIKKSAIECRDWLRNAIAEAEQETIMPTFEEADMKVIHLTQEQKDAFAAKLKEPTKEAALSILDDQGKEMLEKIIAEVEKVSK